MHDSVLGMRMLGRTPDGKKPDKAPQVWKRDKAQQTVARVYVGDGNSLELVSLQVTVTIEGPRARTLVDHVFHNPHDRQLEGTFEYPLPTGASPSYFAMFPGQTREAVPPRFARRGDAPPLPQEALAKMKPAEVTQQVSITDWGSPQEGRIVSKEKALETYEETVRGRIDPALLEYAGGNTFSGRVFPIPRKGYSRVLIAYEELLPCVQGKALYQFPLPECKLADMQFTLQANAAECKKTAFRDGKKPEAEDDGRVSYSRSWTEKGPGGQVLFTFAPSDPRIQAISGRQNENGPVYVYARIRPELKIEAEKPFAEHAVFLLDTSLSEHPDGFAINMKLLRKILETDANIKRFNILAFNIGTNWVSPGAWVANTAEERDKLLKKLDGIVLEGATDMGAALDRLVQAADGAGKGEAFSLDTMKEPVHFFLLSNGQITWGAPDAGPLVARFESQCKFPARFHCYRTGIGADNLELFEALTRRGGGIFNCFNETDVATAAVAHQHECLQVERVTFAGGPAASDVLIAGRKAAVYPNGELVVAVRISGPGHTSVVVEGTFLGDKFVQEYPLEVTTSGELAPRGWGEMAVASLLALNDPKFDSLVTAYGQQFGIASRVASFLVLENPNDYKRLDLEKERGQTITGDLGRFLDDVWKSFAKVVSARESFDRFLAQVDPRVKLLDGKEGEHVKKLLALLKDDDFEPPPTGHLEALCWKQWCSADYLKARDQDRRDVHAYLAEARRRIDLGRVIVDQRPTARTWRGSRVVEHCRRVSGAR